MNIGGARLIKPPKFYLRMRTEVKKRVPWWGLVSIEFAIGAVLGYLLSTWAHS